MYSISSIAPTISRLLGIAPPAHSATDVIEEVAEAARKAGIHTVDRCLIFTPDAVGTFLLRERPSLFRPVEENAPLSISLRSVIPPKTPVCYASMFTGSLPQVHGIKEYVKEPPAVETVFERLVHAGRRAAIVAVRGSTLDTIFRNTGAEHFSETCDKAVTETTLAVAKADRHDLIVAYHQEYDDFLHTGDPRSAEAIRAVGRHAAAFSAIAAALRSDWSGHRYLLTFAPDHGAHFDPSLGTGTHGEDRPEDMEITHFFGLR